MYGASGISRPTVVRRLRKAGPACEFKSIDVQIEGKTESRLPTFSGLSLINPKHAKVQN